MIVALVVTCSIGLAWLDEMRKVSSSQTDLLSSISAKVKAAKYKETEKCDYLIIGGGIAGVYITYSLAKKTDAVICLVQKCDGGYVDVGGKRVNFLHEEMRGLAEELGIELEMGMYYTLNEANQAGVKVNTFMESRDVLTSDPEELREKAFPSLTSTPEDGWALLVDESDSTANELKDTRSFLRYKYGNSESMNYFLANYRFGGDFQGVVRKTYVEFVNQDTTDNRNFYPKKGMQEFVNQMIRFLEFDKNVKLFKGETVERVYRDSVTNPAVLNYRSSSERREFLSPIVIFATPPNGLNLIGGDIGNQLLEQPVTPTGIATNTFRAAYTDGHCALELKDLYLLGGDTLVERTILENLKQLYKGIDIPKPILTHVQIWDNAWHFEQPGAELSMKEKEFWALNPFSNSEKVFMVGEAYNTQRSWSNGAIKSANNLLNKLNV